MVVPDRRQTLVAVDIRQLTVGMLTADKSAISGVVDRVDAITIPLLEPGRRRHHQFSEIQLNRPWWVFEEVLADPFEYPAAERHGGFDNQQHVGSVTASSRCDVKFFALLAVHRMIGWFSAGKGGRMGVRTDIDAGAMIRSRSS